jgi:hypothetical protein
VVKQVRLDAVYCSFGVSLFPVVEDGHEFGCALRENVFVFRLVLEDVGDEFNLSQFFLLVAIGDEGGDVHHG